MNKIALFIAVCLTNLIAAQTFSVGHLSINFKDTIRNNAGYTIPGGISTTTATGRVIGTEVYYPANTNGNNVSLANGQFPVVVFGHGFLMTYDNYDNIYNRLASQGYIVLLPRTEGSASPSHSDFGADLAYLAMAGMGLNTITTPSALAIFNGKVLQKSAIGGHSMGAGSSFLGAKNNTTITCLFNMCAATTNPSSITSASLVSVPSLLISGEMDSVADTTVQNSHYTAIASAKKFHVIISGAKHCDFGNGSSFLCSFGQPSCSGTNCNAILFARYMSYLEPFLANQLKNDCVAGNSFITMIQNPSADRAGRKLTGSIGCGTTHVESQTVLSNFSIFPNPAESRITISYSTESNSLIQFEIYDISGRLVLQLSNMTSNSAVAQELNIETLDKGIYTLNIIQNGCKTAYKIIKQ